MWVNIAGISAPIFLQLLREEMKKVPEQRMDEAG